MSDMKAIGFTSYGDAEVLKELSVPKPVPGDEDVLVRVKATATNPVDCKIRSNWGKGASEVPQEKSPFICGYDGAGVVEAVGKNVTKFKEGDEVYFAGVMSRQGSNADYTLLDERVVALKPKNVSFAEAAGFPLTGLTAIEGLVESLHVRLRENETKDDDDNGEKVLLVIGGAGGVGSMVIQLAKQWLRPLRVVATASRPETVEWCKKLGADDVINHKNNLKEELEKIGVKGVDYVFNTASTEQWFEQIVDIANPLARIVLINETDEKLPLGKGMLKRLTWSYELMFSKPLLNVNPQTQGSWLEKLAASVEEGKIVPTVNTTFDYSVENLQEAHKLQESGKAIGKIVLNM